MCIIKQMSKMREYKTVYRPLFYILVSLGFWALIITINAYNKDGLLGKLEMVRPYVLKKQIPKWQDAWDSAVRKINEQWTTALDTSCFGLTTVSAGACETARKSLVLNVRTELSCKAGGYRSPFCSCIQKVLDPVLKDTRTIDSVATENFNLNGQKNVAGKRDQLISNLESCHYLFHPTTVAEQSDNAATRIGVIMYMISTIVTLVLAEAFIFKFLYPLFHFILVLVFIFLAWFVPYAFFSDSMNFERFINLHIWVFLPSIVIYIWSEFLMGYGGTSLKKGFPIIHPGYFGTLHSLIILLALTQHGILDYDIITTEICKSNILAFLYLCLCVYCANDDEHRSKTTSYWDEPTFYTLLTISVLSISTAVAPYPNTHENTVLWSIPFAFTAFSAFYALWFGHNNRLKKSTPDNVSMNGYENTFSEGAYLAATFLLLITAIILWVGVGDYWRTERLFVDRYLVTTVQFNQTNWAWMNPVFSTPLF